MFQRVSCLVLVLFSFSLLGFTPPNQDQTSPFLPLCSIDLDSSTLIQICQDGIIRIGVKEDFPPFSSKEEEEFVGFDIELIEEILKRWLGAPVSCKEETLCKFEIVNSENGTLFLKQNKIDLLIGGLTYTRERDKDVDFSQVYFMDGQGILVKVVTSIQTVNGLAKEEVVVKRGTTAETVCNTLNLDIQVQCASFSGEHREIILDRVKSGSAIAYISDANFLSEIADEDPDFQVVKNNETGLPYTFTKEPYSIAVQQGDPIRELVNVTLEEMKADGFYDALSRNHFPDRQPYSIEVGSGDHGYSGLTLRENYSRSDLMDIRGKKVIVGVKFDSKPFGYLDEKGNLVGFDIDLANAIAKLWGVTPIFVPVTSANRIEKLQSGEVDMVIATMTHSWPRSELIAFSNTYFFDGQGLLSFQDSSISKLEDLNEEINIVALKGSTSLKNIQNLVSDLGLPADIVIEASSRDEAEKMITSREVEFFTSDSILLSEIARGFNQKLDDTDSRLVVFDNVFSREPYGIGLPIDDYQFIKRVNCTLQELKLNGTYNDIYTATFKGDGVIPYAVETFIGNPQCEAYAETSGLPNSTSWVEKLQDPINLTIAVLSGSLTEDWEKALVSEMITRWNNESDNIDYEFVSVSDIGQISQDTIMVIGGVQPTNDQPQPIDYSQIILVDTRSEDIQSENVQLQYAIGLPKNDYLFQQLVNLTLQEMTCDQTYNKLYEASFSDEEKLFVSGDGKKEAYFMEIWPGKPIDENFQGINFKSNEQTERLPECERPEEPIPGCNSMIYTVKSGDTLSEIAAEWYGNGNDFETDKIHEDNFNTIGSDKSKISVGMQLKLRRNRLIEHPLPGSIICDVGIQ